MPTSTRTSLVCLTLLILTVPHLCLAQVQPTFFTPPTYSPGSSCVPLQTFFADLNGDGILDAVSCSSQGVTVQLGNGDGTFTTLSTTQSGTPLAVADFNGDGNLDILEQGTGTLLVLLGNGDGTFQSPVSSTSGASLLGVVAADLNGDGKADALGVFNNSLIVYLSTGNGFFAPGVSYDLGIGASNDQSVVISLVDLNGDGKTDAAINISFYTAALHSFVVSLLGNGNGTFGSAVNLNSVDYPAQVATGDFNLDGKVDLAIASGNGSGAVSLQLGNGDGTFQAPTSVATANWVAAADLNGDGKVDLIVSDVNNSSVYLYTVLQVLFGNGDGTFTPGLQYQQVGRIDAIADFNRDGQADVAVAGSILLGNGDGSFQGWPAAALNSSPLLSAQGDFNKDGIPDAAVISGSAGCCVTNSVNIVLSQENGSISLAHTYPIAQAQVVSAIAATDLNGDGSLDLVILGWNDLDPGVSFVTVLLGNGDGSFQASVTYTFSGSVYGTSSLLVSDFNNDHKMDIAVPTGNTVSVLLGNGDGTFATPGTYFDGSANSLATADFNSDGNMDIVAAGSSGLALLLGNGDGTFQAATFPYTISFSQVVEADANKDGKADLITINANGTQVYLGNGDGTFTTLPPSSCSIEYIGEQGDFNLDGNVDLLALQHPALGMVTDGGLCLSNGDGTFDSFTGLYLEQDSGNLYVSFSSPVDVNNDGKPDLFIGGYTSSSVYVMLNTTPAGPQVTLSPTSVAFAAQTVGTTSPATTIVLTNSGNSSLSVTSVTIAGANAAEFAQTNNCTTVAIGATCTINVTFAPTATGTFSGTLSITDNAANSPQEVALTGTGMPPTPPPVLVVSPSSLAFGSQAVNTASFPQTITLSNPSSTVPVDIAQIAASGDFKQTSTCGATLFGLSSCTISATFTPTASGTRGGAITITDDVGRQSVTLSGTGVAATLGLGIASGSSSSQTVSAGSSASYKLSIGGQGVSGAATLSCSGTPMASTCSLSPTSVPVSATLLSTFTVTVATTARSSARLDHAPEHTSTTWMWALGIFGVLFLPTSSSRKKILKRATGIVMLSVMLILLSGCGGGGSNSTPPAQTGTPAGTYTLTVNATTGTANQSIPLTLIVQ